MWIYNTTLSSIDEHWTGLTILLLWIMLLWYLGTSFCVDIINFTGSGTAGFISLRNHYIAFQNGCILHSYQQWMGIPSSLHFCQYLLSVFLIFIILLSVKWFWFAFNIILIFIYKHFICNELSLNVLCIVHVLYTPARPKWSVSCSSHSTSNWRSIVHWF